MVVCTGKVTQLTYSFKCTLLFHPLFQPPQCTHMLQKKDVSNALLSCKCMRLRTRLNLALKHCLLYQRVSGIFENPSYLVHGLCLCSWANSCQMSPLLSGTLSSKTTRLRKAPHTRSVRRTVGLQLNVQWKASTKTPWWEHNAFDVNVIYIFYKCSFIY